jgi:hypothetical protein
MSSFKIIGRSLRTGRQVKKRVYVTEEDFNKYKDPLIQRYERYLDVEVYRLQDNKWELIDAFPCTEQHLI